MSRLEGMETTFRQPDVADLFERLLVPSVFERYARDLVERARPFGPADRILDLGCGTGIVARVLRERLGGAACIAGVDLSPAMIARARAIAPDIEWHQGNALALPFADGAFDVVLSQQVLQFTGDRAAAVREIRRVLAPGGRLVASTWRPRQHQPLYHALGEVAERHLGRSADLRWSLDGEELRALLVDAGFTEVRIDTASLIERYREFPVRLSATAANHDLSALDDDERERRWAAVEADSAAVLAGFSAEGGFANPSVTNVVVARVS
jgi:ubiquinone/menaquinone biosynthesis C-methylase UbiE